MEQIRERINQNLGDILKDSKEILEKYSLSGVKVTGFKVGKKTEQIKPDKAPLLRDFNEILERRNLQDAYIVDFTLAQESNEKESSCTVEIKDGRIYVVCGYSQ